MIKVYALSTCGHCRRARKLLDKLGVEYTAVEVDQLGGEERSQILSEMRQYNPALSFPTLLIGDRVIVGNRENLIRESLEGR